MKENDLVRVIKTNQGSHIVGGKIGVIITFNECAQNNSKLALIQYIWPNGDLAGTEYLPLDCLRLEESVNGASAYWHYQKKQKNKKAISRRRFNQS